MSSAERSAWPGTLRSQIEVLQRSADKGAVGRLPVVVTHGEKQCELHVLVVDGEGPDLLGRDWMAARNVIFSVGDVHTVEQELGHYQRYLLSIPPTLPRS
jgi:hypothetical protein